MKTWQFVIEEKLKRLRLDRFLYDQIGTVSRMFLADLLAANLVLVNDEPQPGGYHLQRGDKIELSFDERAETSMTPENLPLDVLFEDEEILIVNKPAGMLVHPTRAIRSGTLANALAFHLNFNGQSELSETPLVRPGLVHRLDKDTSGLLVVAKTPRAHRILSAHFERKLIKKLYLAVVEGKLEADAGEITAPIGRIEEKPHWRVLENGKPAETRFRVLEKRQNSSLLELEPITGRTNQLRIHTAHLGHPIVGDQLYGGRGFSRLCLHAMRLAFFHPNGGWLEFEIEPPPEFTEPN